MIVLIIIYKLIYNNMNTNFYEKKYFKYKNKYFQLKNQLAGGKETAKRYFDLKFDLSNVKHKYKIQQKEEEMKIIIRNFLNDSYLVSEYNKIEGENNRVPGIKPNIEAINDPISRKEILDKIFDVIERTVNDSKIIDLVCTIYLDGKLGTPNSLENIGRFKDNWKKYIILKNIGTPGLPTTFKSLEELESYIDSQFLIFEDLDEKQQDESKQKERQIKIKELGEKDVEIIMNNESIIIYKPTSEHGSRYYGRNTRWCTAADDNCMFEHYYSPENPLYIIVPKNDPLNKYQVHFKTCQLMDVNDKPFKATILKKKINNHEFNIWFDLMKVNFDKEYLNRINYKNFNNVSWDDDIKLIQENGDKIETWNVEENIDFNVICTVLRFAKNLKKLVFSNDFDKMIGEYIGEYYNIENYLNNLTVLEELHFGNNFNQPLESSLINLNKLKILNLGNKYNHPLEYSLRHFYGLEKLYIGNNYNHPFEKSLFGLRSLRILVIGDGYNFPFDNALDSCINLEELYIGNGFNQNLYDSLFRVINLRVLRLGNSYNQTLKMSLSKLENLSELVIGDSYNESFDDLFKNLRILRKLKIGNGYTRPLGESLYYLENLVILEIGDGFNSSLENVFLKNRYLQNLSIGNSYNQPFGNSLMCLLNLKLLKLGDSFNQELRNSLIENINLEFLIFGNNFNKDLDRSLFTLRNLKLVVFGNNFDYSVDDSLDNNELINRIQFGNNFNKSVNSFLSKHQNLKEIIFGDNFNQELNLSYNRQLVKIQFGKNYNQSLEPIERLLSYSLKNISVPKISHIKKKKITNRQLRNIINYI